VNQSRVVHPPNDPLPTTAAGQRSRSEIRSSRAMPPLKEPSKVGKLVVDRAGASRTI